MASTEDRAVHNPLGVFPCADGGAATFHAEAGDEIDLVLHQEREERRRARGRLSGVGSPVLRRELHPQLPWDVNAVDLVSICCLIFVASGTPT